MTAAHRTLPFGSRLRVTNLANQRSVLVTVNDRGPFSGGRILDLSAGAANVIGMRQSGVARVHIERLDRVASLQAN
jgi:rare lipoprotein A